MNWLWLNIPLGSLIFLAVAGIPMWLVLKHPDTRQHIPGARAARQPDLIPVYAAANTRAGAAGRQQRPGTASEPERAGGAVPVRAQVARTSEGLKLTGSSS
jgi:hypothetical protein